MCTIYVQVGDDKRMIFPSVDLESTFGAFEKIVAEKFGSSDFHLNLGKLYCQKLVTLAQVGAEEGTVFTLAPNTSKEARGKKRFAKGETGKRSKYAKLMAQGVNTRQAVDTVKTDTETLIKQGNEH